MQLMARRFAGAAVGCMLAFQVVACSAPEVQNCQRYDVASLNRENGFSARIDWKNDRLLDLPGERMEVALTAIRPIRGTIELVHIVGDTEADRWPLTLPNFTNAPTSLCSIAPPGVAPSCGASLQHLPLSPGGYYYLLADGNTVLEAGLAFWLCN